MSFFRSQIIQRIVFKLVAVFKLVDILLILFVMYVYGCMYVCVCVYVCVFNIFFFIILNISI